MALKRVQTSSNIVIFFTPKIESPVAYATPDIPPKFQKDPSITFWVILCTRTHTDKQKLAKTLPPWRR